ncbi:lysophospholipase L1-like esterase [Streptacidiphilus sp. MAP12-16]|uniref:SGNH/GDSL hydrolase family protein n=1 Tax=Streptacidiphilus sp. MAP12-16 TaxID=3156300 RepID=UPI003513DAFF
MSGESTARRIAAAAAYGGSAIGLLVVGLAGLLLTEAKIAEIQLDALKGEPPRADGLYGMAFANGDAPPLALVVVGDSTAAGFGVDRGRETPGALLAAGIASIAERPVRLVVAAANGAASDDMERQLDLVLRAEPTPDIALIMVGVNDIAKRIRQTDSARMLGDAVRRLRAVGAEVVVGTCPDLGVVEPVRPPLRALARQASRRLAAAQATAVVRAGGHSVALGDLLGPEFVHKREMFASDRYHPSARGYQTAAMALLPTMCAALGVWPQDERRAAIGREDAQRAPDPGRPGPGEPDPVEPSDGDGSGTEALGIATGPTGRWALSKHRSQLHLLAGESTTPESYSAQ